ncbi:MAG: glycosyltransferase family 2 protein [Pseudomonadota bacterium]
MSPEVSIVITTHNEEAGIAGTLQSLKAQTGAPEFEVVMVDDRSTDATIARAEAVRLAGLRVLHNAPEPDSTLTTRQQALDMAFRAAKAPVIVTLDGDSTVPRGWVAAMAGPILAGDAPAVAGPITFAPPDTAVARWQIADAAYYFEVAARLAPYGAGGVFFGSFAFRAELYTDIGGFDAIGGALTEDLAFARALQAAGHRIAFVPGPGPVEVAPCPSRDALIDRTIRVSAGPPSLLAAVLSIWPLTLMLTALLAPFGPGLMALFVLRFAAGAAFVRYAIKRTGAVARGLNWLTYEILAIGLALSVLARIRQDGAKTSWGGQNYDR